MIRSLTLAALALFLITSPAAGKCFSWRCDESEASSKRETSRTYITNTHRQTVGDVYDPGAGRRLQVRDKHPRLFPFP